MCFIVLEHEHQPMKVRGERVIAATVIPLHENALSAGTYVSAQSGHCMDVKSVGLLADAAPGARPAYAAMRAIGVTLDENGSNTADGAVYLPIDCPYTIQAFRGKLTTVNPYVDLFNYWLPAQIVTINSQAEGWFRISGEQFCQLLVVSNIFEDVEKVSVVLQNMSSTAWSVAEIERIEEWNTQKWLRIPSSTRQVITV